MSKKEYEKYLKKAEMARKQVAAGKMSQKELRQYLQSMADEVPDFYDGYDPL